MSHPKYDVFKKAIAALNGAQPPQGWAEQLLKRLVAAGATDADLREISEQIKRGFKPS